MSDVIITALGSIIGAIITSVGVIIAAYIKKPHIEGSVKQSVKFNKKQSLLLIIMGTIIGAIVTLLILAPLVDLPLGLMDTTIYDDFNNSSFNGNINNNLWSPVVKPPNYIRQENGWLSFSVEPNGEKITSLVALKKIRSGQYNFAESKLLLSSANKSQNGEAGLALKTIDKKGEDLIYLCTISKLPPVQIWCEVYGRTDVAEYLTDKIVTNYDVWHTVRIEIDPEINATFYIDGQKIGFYRPNDAQELKNYYFTLRLETWSPFQEGIKAYFDDVRYGQYK